MTLLSSRRRMTRHQLLFVLLAALLSRFFLQESSLLFKTTTISSGGGGGGGGIVEEPDFSAPILNHNNDNKGNRVNHQTTITNDSLATKNDRVVLVLSYSLTPSDDDSSIEAMVKTASQVPEFYPEWEVWIYHNNSSSSNVEVLAAMKHVRLINIQTYPWVSQTDLPPQSWRFLVASASASLTAFQIRNVAARPSHRERAAVDEWLSLGDKSFHIMRDHPLHDPTRFAPPIMGGMWGARRNAVPDMEDRLRRYYYASNSSTTTAPTRSDVNFLTDEILPLARNDCLQHDSYYCNETGGIAFPVKRENEHFFVGNEFNNKYASQKDKRLGQAVERYEHCLKLRNEALTAGNKLLPDTSYKIGVGESKRSSWQDHVAKRKQSYDARIEKKKKISDGTTTSHENKAAANTSSSKKLSDASHTRLVLSYSLYGNDPKYTSGMVTTASQVPHAYPGWDVQIYHDAQVPFSILAQLGNMSHVTLVQVDSWVLLTVNPMSWRFLVASDPTVRAFGIRDADSRPTRREKAAVDEWLLSSNNKSFHIMRDHPWHDPSRFAVILGGMWGGHYMPDMERMVRQHYNTTTTTTTTNFDYAEDQDFLWKYILPLAQNDCVQHDSYYCTDSGGIAFPVPREVDKKRPYLYDYAGNSINRQQGGPLQKDRLLESAASMKEFHRCMELRREQMMTMMMMNSTNTTTLLLPDTSYKGRTDLSSTKMLAEKLKNLQG